MAASAGSQLTCDGRQPTIYAGPEVTGEIIGTRRADVIVVVSDRIAWSGHPRQVIDAKRGDDRVCTFGGWNYKVDGGPGRDRIWTGDGDDYIFGGAGPDTMSSGDGNDHLKAGVGAAPDDYAYCGPGYDRVENVSPYTSFDCERIVLASLDSTGQ